MKFSEIIDQASVLLQRSGRMTYRALKREFDLSDEDLDILKEELMRPAYPRWTKTARCWCGSATGDQRRKG